MFMRQLHFCACILALYKIDLFIYFNIYLRIDWWLPVFAIYEDIFATDIF